MQACDRCHSRKTRCDRRIPQCSACEKAGVACLHIDKLRQRNVPRGYVDNMEVQVKKLLEENRRLRDQLPISRSELKENQSYNDKNEIKVTSINKKSMGNSGSINGQGDSIEQDSLSSREDEDSRSQSSQSSSDVLKEVEYLSLKATGETRYLGSSSGVDLASIIDSLIDMKKRVFLPSMEKDHNASDTQGSEIISSTGISLDSSIPSFTTAAQFIEAYFQHTHVIFPLLHRPTFLDTVKLIYNQPGYYENHPYENYVFNMVLAIGSSNFNRFDEATAHPTSHYRRAEAGLNSVLRLPGLNPLKAIILLSQHGIFSNLRDTSASIYHLVGILVRICFEHGLHSNLKYGHGHQKSGAQHVTFEEEMRRRCFWCLYNLDRVVSFTLGRPAALRDRDINISLPSYLADEDFAPDKPIMEDPGSKSISGSPISPFIHLIRIRRLSGEIMSKFYSINQEEEATLEEKLSIRTKLHEKLISWRNDIKLLNLKLINPSMDGSSYVSCFLTPEWWTAVFNNAILLLYRPSPYLPQHSVTLGLVGGEDYVTLFSAAKEAILAYADVHRRRRLNYSWITLHGVFVAGLAYVYAVGRALKNSEQALSLELLDIINDTRACSNMLVAISERWNMGHRSCELFNQLSAAVIRNLANKTSSQIVNSNKELTGRKQASGNYTGYSSTKEIRDQLPLHCYDTLIDAETLGYEFLPGHVNVFDESRNYSSTFDSISMGPIEQVDTLFDNWAFEENIVCPSI